MDQSFDHVVKSFHLKLVVLAGDHGTGKTFMLNRIVR
jgi:putative ribosome biogenesis GTPase RsgA